MANKTISFEEFVTKFRKILREGYQRIGDSMMGGGAKNMEQYNFMLGEARAYQLMDREISDLLNPKEEKNNEQKDNNVIKFGKDGGNTEN